VRRLISLLALSVLAACGITVTTDVIPRSSAELRGESLLRALDEEFEVLGAALVAKQEASSDLPVDPTIDEYFAAANRIAATYGQALDEADAALERLRVLVDESIHNGSLAELGIDGAQLTELIEEFSLWLEAEKLQNDPDICAEHISRERGDIRFAEAISPAYAQCMAQFLSNPLIERGSFQAAVRIRELSQELMSSW